MIKTRASRSQMRGMVSVAHNVSGETMMFDNPAHWSARLRDLVDRLIFQRLARDREWEYNPVCQRVAAHPDRGSGNNDRRAQSACLPTRLRVDKLERTPAERQPGFTVGVPATTDRDKSIDITDQQARHHLFDCPIRTSRHRLPNMQQCRAAMSLDRRMECPHLFP